LRIGEIKRLCKYQRKFNLQPKVTERERLTKQTMDKERVDWAEKQAQYYKTLTCPRRVLILWVLAERELSVGEIATEVGASMQNTSQHLKIMKKRGILDCRRDGQTIFYFVVDRKLLSNMGIPSEIGNLSKT